MNSNDIIKEVYAAFVHKAKRDIAAGEKCQKAVDFGTDVIDVGRSWTESIGNDGKISDDEEKKMNDVFGSIVDKRCKNQSGLGVTALYKGVTLFGFGFKGIRHYLNKWFDLDLA